MFARVVGAILGLALAVVVTEAAHPGQVSQALGVYWPF